MKSRLLIPARGADEDISWIEQTNTPSICYQFRDKSKENYIENIGSEDGIYLQHIIMTYPNFQDITIFTQAKPFDHCPTMINKVINIEKLMDGGTGYLGLSEGNGIVNKDGSPQHHGLPMEQVFHMIFGNDIKCPDEFKCTFSGMFSVYKENILERPLDFYKNMLGVRMLTPQRYTQIGCCIERFWHIIFQKKLFGY